MYELRCLMLRYMLKMNIDMQTIDSELVSHESKSTGAEMQNLKCFWVRDTNVAKWQFKIPLKTVFTL